MERQVQLSNQKEVEQGMPAPPYFSKTSQFDFGRQIFKGTRWQMECLARGKAT
jgi:hypothetical protein